MSLIFRVALGLLPVLPAAIEEVEDIIAEVKSGDDAEAKIQGVIDHLEALLAKLKAAV